MTQDSKATMTHEEHTTRASSSIWSKITKAFFVLVLFSLLASQGYLMYRVDQLSNRLEYVQTLAENADQYAHTHY